MASWSSQRTIPPNPKRAIVRFGEPSQKRDVLAPPCSHQPVMQELNLKKGERGRHCIVWNLGVVRQAHQGHAIEKLRRLLLRRRTGCSGWPVCGELAKELHRSVKLTGTAKKRLVSERHPNH